jgi:hypothetical protein
LFLLRPVGGHHLHRPLHSRELALFLSYPHVAASDCVTAQSRIQRDLN